MVFLIPLILFARPSSGRHLRAEMVELRADFDSCNLYKERSIRILHITN